MKTPVDSSPSRPVYPVIYLFLLLLEFQPSSPRVTNGWHENKVVEGLTQKTEPGTIRLKLTT